MSQKQGLRVLIEQTQKFIEENPSDVVLTRTERADDEAGGYTDGDLVPVPAQRVRLVPANPSAAVEVRNTSGEVVKTAYSMVGLPNANVKENDSLMIDGLRYEVAQAVVIGGYVFRAELVRRG